jgi:hypothetical protein
VEPGETRHRVLLQCSRASANRRLLALGADDQLRLYDLESRIELGGSIPLPFDDADQHNDGHAVGLRPDGLEAAAIVDGGIAVWDLDPSTGSRRRAHSPAAT